MLEFENITSKKKNTHGHITHVCSTRKKKANASNTTGTRSVLRYVDDISRLAGRVTSGTASPMCLLSLAESLDRLPSLANSIATIQQINQDPLHSSQLLDWSKRTRNTLTSTTSSETNFITSVFEQQQQQQQPILRPGADEEVDRLREEAKEYLEKMQDVVRKERDLLGGEIPVSLRLTRMFGHVRILYFFSNNTTRISDSNSNTNRYLRYHLDTVRKTSYPNDIDVNNP